MSEEKQSKKRETVDEAIARRAKELAAQFRPMTDADARFVAFAFARRPEK
ncbi:hypothetical protein ACWDTT_15855 [Streptosporangium sandarakinum]